MNRWNSKPLNEVAINISRPFKSKNDKAIFLNTGDVLEGVFLHRDYSSIKNMPGQAKKALLKGDILFSEIRPGNKRFALVEFDPQDYIVSTKFMVIRPLDEKILLPSFLYLVLTQDNNLEYCQLIAESRSGTFPQITFDSIDNIEVPLPSIDYQKRITSFKKQFDDKIELNRQMNRTLEQMARALFKSWFIDFDPVHAKQRGEQPAGLDAETATLFPDRFVEINGKEVPEGWAYGSVSDIAQQVKTQMNPSDHPDALFAHFSIPAFDASGRPAIERGSEIKSNKFVVPDAAILVSKLNPATPRIWDTDLSDDTEYRVSSTEFIPLVTRSGEIRAFLYLALTSHDFAKALSGQASGTSNSHQRVKPSDILSAPVMLAPSEVIAAFGSLVLPILDHAKRNLREINQLTGLRDSLLPRLLSGELDVSDWETAVEAAEGAPS